MLGILRLFSNPNNIPIKDLISMIDFNASAYHQKCFLGSCQFYVTRYMTRFN